MPSWDRPARRMTAFLRESGADAVEEDSGIRLSYENTIRNS
jgi:hypothetical protein